MKLKIKEYKEKYQKIWMLPSLFFGIFNLALGIYSSSIYSVSVAIYYFCLFVLRLIVNQKISPQKIYGFYAALIVLDFALIIPILMMLLQQKEINFGLIIAITMATYTTYKVVLTVLYIIKNKKNDITQVRMKMLIHIIDSGVSIINLQYALIIVNGGFTANENMAVLSLISSLSIFLIMIVFSILFFKKERVALKKKW